MNPKIARSSFTITFFSVLGGLVNYVSIALLAFYFGTGWEIDAYFSAITLPQIVLAILGTVLTNSFIPLFIEIKIRDERQAWEVASTSLNMLFLILLLFTSLGILFPRALLKLMSPGLSASASLLAAAVFQIFLLASIFSGVSIILTGLYYSQQRFFLPCFAQALVSAITLLFVIFTRGTFGIKSIAFGNLAGSLIQFLMLLPIIAQGHHYRFMFNPKQAEVLKLGRNLSPLLMGAIFYRSNPLVERFIASRLGEGAISYLGFAYKIVMFLLMIISPGISTAIFPKMSEYSAKRDFQGLKELLSRGVRALILITVPVVVWMAMFRVELVRFFFQRGGFTAADTKAVADTLLAYVGFFVIGAIGLPIVNVFYSLQETLKVALVGVCGFIFYVILAFIFADHFSYLGVALAISLQYVVSFIVYIFLLKKRIGHLVDAAFSLCLIKSILAAALAALVVLPIHRMALKSIAFPLGLGLTIGINLTIYLLLLLAFRTDELRFLPLGDFFMRKSASRPR